MSGVHALEHSSQDLSYDTSALNFHKDVVFPYHNSINTMIVISIYLPKV